MPKILSLKGKIKNYIWGGSNYIPDLLGIKSENKKYAEYWLGAHINAPSFVVTDKGELNLDEFLNSNLIKGLGDKTAKKFGRLPFLFKVLDVCEMLSIQVHPTKVGAEKGFKRENDLGIPLNASYRNYKDNNHKPEIMVALSEFWLLHGFLPKDKLVKVLSSIPEFSILQTVFNEKGYLGLYQKVMSQTVEETNQMLRPLIKRIVPLSKSGKLNKSDPAFWAAKAVISATKEADLDKGIYSIYFFNLVKVDKGEAVFQDAGIPHAYLEGQNMELMANSDNVLRGGLTSKHIDVPELLKHIVFQETIQNIIKGKIQSNGLEFVYKSPALDFELSQIRLSGNKEEEYQSKSNSAQIIIVIEGNITLQEEDSLSDLILNKGQSAFIMADCDYKISSTTSAVLYKATSP